MARSTTRTLAFGLALTALGSLAAGCDHGSGTEIGPEGGVVVSEDGRLTLEVPAGALHDAVDVSIHAVDEGPDGAVRVYAIEPMGTPLVLPAMVEYDWSATAGAEGLSLESSSMTDPTLVIERGDEWRQLADRTVDADAQYVAASANYFGIVAVVPVAQ
ncbi:MAG: hypothetical protein AAGA54_31855 [Myxococcota bacterium]